MNKVEQSREFSGGSPGRRRRRQPPVLKFWPETVGGTILVDASECEETKKDGLKNAPVECETAESTANRSNEIEIGLWKPPLRSLIG